MRMRLQEDMKKQLSAEGKYTEEELEEYMQTHEKVMTDSLWKLNVADIEATLSRVSQKILQDGNVKKDELPALAKGLKTLGKIFQRAKSANDENGLNGAVHKLNGSESCPDACFSITSPESPNSDMASATLSQSPYVEALQFTGAQLNFPRPTAPPGAQRHAPVS